MLVISFKTLYYSFSHNNMRINTNGYHKAVNNHSWLYFYVLKCINCGHKCHYLQIGFKRYLKLFLYSIPYRNEV